MGGAQPRQINHKTLILAGYQALTFAANGKYISGGYVTTHIQTITSERHPG